ncbi:MAG TPA: DUF6152 family protein [Longimicrobiales bacterium]|nr:DUF6152 family protein [Longimicrobiales bacterium]
MKKTTALFVGGLAALAAAAPLVAHHAFGAEFDRDAPIRMEGRVTRLEWVNPHTWIHIAITEMTKEGETVRPANPDEEVWAVEGGTPNTLLRRGLRRDCLAIGTVVIVDGYQTKDHSLKRANGRDITFADGAKMFLGSSGTGAPYDADAVQQRQEQGRC